MARNVPLKIFLLTSLSAVALAGCSGGGTQQAKTDAPMPPITEIDAAMNAPAPKPLSSGDTLTPIMPKASGTAEERLALLEQKVEDLRADFDRIKPAFASLNTTNERIQKLLGEVEQETAAMSSPSSSLAVAATPTPIATKSLVPVTGTIPAPGTISRMDNTPKVTMAQGADKSVTAPIVTAPAAGFKTTPTAEEARAEAARQTGQESRQTIPATEPIAKAEAVPAGATSVRGVRIGEHGSKTRIVLDLAGASKPDFKYDIDNAEKLLLVELAGTAWSGAATGAPKSPLIQSWAAQGTPSGGAALAVQLKKGARILSSEYLKPEGSSPARIVLDIAAEG